MWRRLIHSRKKLIGVKKKSQILELGFSAYLSNSSWVGKITQKTTTL